LIRLHKNLDPILETRTNVVKAGDYVYTVPGNDYEVHTVVGGEKDIDSPFTMWEISRIAGNTRQMLRLSLAMRDGTFSARIRGRDSFHAYGESILLQKIEFEDLATFDGGRSEEYRQAFARFKAGRHAIPNVFEYLVVSEDDVPLNWEATPLSAGLSARGIPYPELKQNTVWFFTNIVSATFRIVGRPKYNAFALRLTAAPRGIPARL